MKALVVFAAALAGASLMPLHAATLGGPITNAANGHLYYLLSEDTWQNSESQAVALGGHLATINDQAEQDWVFATFGSYGGTNLSLWIGLREVGVEGNHQWVNGEPFTYANWCCNQPDNSLGDESYVHMIKTGNIYGHPGGTWNDIRSPNIFYPPFDPLCGVVEVGGAHSPRLNAALPTVDGQKRLALTWDSLAAATYRVQARAALATDSPWATIASVTSVSNRTTWIDPNKLEQSRFYQLLLPTAEITRVEPSIVVEQSGPPPTFKGQAKDLGDGGTTIYIIGQLFESNDVVRVGGAPLENQQFLNRTLIRGTARHCRRGFTMCN